MHSIILKASWFDTVLGPMVVISDDEGLYLLEFSEGGGLDEEIERLRLKKKVTIISGETQPTTMIKKELGLYFSGKLTSFKTPLHLIGSEFQKKTWHVLMQIPYGQTSSYKSQAKMMGCDKAFRAVANANAANPLAIIVPCHRIINHNGNLSGYAGGKARKKWLIDHEKQSLFE